MGISDWTFIFPESDDLAYQDRELNLPTLDDFDLQIAVFEVYTEWTIEHMLCYSIAAEIMKRNWGWFSFSALSIRDLQRSSAKLMTFSWLGG